MLGLLVGCSSGGGDIGPGGPPGNPGGGGGGGGSTGNGGNPGNSGLGGATLRNGPQGQSLTPPINLVVHNDADVARVETIRASVPFAEGQVTSLTTMGVRGNYAAWMPLEHWPDGSIRIAQVQFTALVDANSYGVYEVVSGINALTDPFQENEWMGKFGDQLQFGARVRDTFGVPYEAIVSGPGEVVQETFLTRVRRYRTYHRATQGGGIGRDYLTSTFYVTEFREAPYILVDWVVGNDYQGIDDASGKSDPNWFPLGSIDLMSAQFLVKGATEVRPYEAALHAIPAPTVDSEGWTSFEVIKNSYMADGQTRRYRFGLMLEAPGAPAYLTKAWDQMFGAFIEEPMFALASLESWQETGAMGLHGGPITGPSDPAPFIAQDIKQWETWSTFGTWGDFGDTKYSNTTGTPRNAPVSPELAHAAQTLDFRFLRILEQKAWAQAMRPYHLYGLQVGARQDILLWDPIPYFPGSRGLSHENLGRKTLWDNDPYPQYRTNVDFKRHGWNGYDHEHWSTDLLFDYWSGAGGAWAKEELRQLGESLKALMRLEKYATSYIQAARAEGWCMQGFAQIYLVTGDESIKDYAIERIEEVVEPQRAQWHTSKCLVMQDTYAGTGYPGQHKFFMPWQHAPVVYGFLAAYEYFGNANALRIVEDVVPMMDYSWVTNYNDPKWGFVANGLRYYVPTESQGVPVPANYFDATVGVKWGDSPLGGAHNFLISALHLVAKVTRDPSAAQRALFYGNTIMGPLDDHARWYKWDLLVDENEVP